MFRLFLILVVVFVSVFFTFYHRKKLKSDIEIFFENEFENLWKREFDDRRLVALSHIHRAFQRLLKRGDKGLLRKRLPSLIQETRINHRSLSHHYTGSLYLAANRKFTEMWERSL